MADDEFYLPRLTSEPSETFRPRGAPTAEPNAYVDSYNDWDLVHRGAMAPWGVYERDGQTSAGFAWPSMITEPIEAGKRFLSPGGGFENLPNEQSTQDATTLLLSMYGGNALNPAAAIPKNALGMFAGRKAATADHKALALAERLAAEGADRNSIWNQTGWFQGPDKQWRFEIDDSGSKLAAEPSSYISDRAGPYRGSSAEILNHKNVYDAYPSIADTPMSVYFEPTAGGAAWDGSIMAYGPDVHNVLSTSLHEVQHGIQAQEGFARGGNRSIFSPDQIAAERARIGAVPEDLTGWTSVGSAAGDMPDTDVAHALYRRLAGETEARNVQKRMNMSAEERRATPPWETQDIPYEDQIVRLLSDTGKPSLLGSALASQTALPKAMTLEEQIASITNSTRPHRAAMRFGDEIFTGVNHGVALANAEAKLGDKVWENWNRQTGYPEGTEGFITKDGTFLTRNEAARNTPGYYNPDGEMHASSLKDYGLLSDTGKPSLLGSALAGAQEGKWSQQAIADRMRQKMVNKSEKITKDSHNKPTEVFSGYRGVADPRYHGPHPKSKANAYWMTDDPNIASSYALEFPEERPAVLRTEARFENPLTIDADGASWQNIPHNGDEYYANELAVMARDMGHDGLILRNVIDPSNGGVSGSDMSNVAAALTHGTVHSSLSREILYSDNRPSLLGSALAGAQGERPWWER